MTGTAITTHRVTPTATHAAGIVYLPCIIVQMRINFVFPVLAPVEAVIEVGVHIEVEVDFQVQTGITATAMKIHIIPMVHIIHTDQATVLEDEEGTVTQDHTQATILVISSIAHSTTKLALADMATVVLGFIRLHTIRTP